MPLANLVGYWPPPRYFVPPSPWLHVQIFESATIDGTYTLIATQDLDPLDTDPTQPQPRNISVNATLSDSWLQLVFTDDAGITSEPSEPVRNSDAEAPLPPSPDDIRNQSPLLRKGFPLPNPDPYSVADLRNIVYNATAMVQAFTWRIIDPTLGCAAPEDEVCEIVPDALVPIAFQAIRLMSERVYVTEQPQLAQQIATGRRLRGFNAGPYSENYFAPGEFARRGVVSRPPMDQDDALDQALWALATEDARDYHVWRSTGVAPPVGVVTAFDYRRATLGYSAGSMGGFGGGHGGPDGF